MPNWQIHASFIEAKTMPPPGAKRMSNAGPIAMPTRLHPTECGTHCEANRGCYRFSDGAKAAARVGCPT